MYTEPHPIKVANTAPSETTWADEIAIETAKTSKVTAVVTVISTFSKKKCKSQSANLLLTKRRKVPISRGKIPADQETFLRNQEKT